MAASPPGARRKGVALYSANSAIGGSLAARFKALGRPLAAEGDLNAFLASAQKPIEADAVILDVGDGTILDDPRLAVARERLEGRPLLVVSDALTPDRVRAVVRLQAADWLQRPFTEAEFSASLAQVEGAGAAAAHVTTFIGASGGAGATTLALMAAQYLVGRAKTGETAVVDLDFQSASCSAFLNLGKEVDLEALLANPDRLDPELLEVIKLERPPGLVLYSFERPDLYFAPNGTQFVLRLLDQVALKHREVIIDLPNLHTAWFDDVIRASDHVFVVFESNVPSLRQARRAVQHIRTIRGSRPGLMPIANKTSFKLFGNVISRGDITKLLGEGKFHAISRDDVLATDALNRALIPTEISSRSKMATEASHAFKDILEA